MNSPAVAPDVAGIAFALYKVSDVARTRRFYEDMLGLKICSEMEFAPGQWWIEYDAGGPSALGVTNFGMPDAAAAKNSGVALEITNYDDVLARAKAAGVAITWGPNEFPVCRCFGVKDPDGNELFFHQRKAQG